MDAYIFTHPLKFFTMGFFDGAGAGLLGSLGGVAGSLIGGSIDYNYQKKLMARQDRYNKENAATAYARQRELTADQAYLSQLGKLKAGVNTAFGNDGNVTTSANVDQASPVSIPSPLGVGQQLSSSLRSFMQDSLVNAQRRNVDADTNAKNIDNATRAIKNALDIGKQKQDIGVSMLNYAKDAFKFAVDQQYYQRQQAAQTEQQEADAKRAESLKAIEEVNAMFQYSRNDAELQKAYQEFENLKKVYDLTDAQIVTEKGKPRVQLSEIHKNEASANASNTQASLNLANKGYVDEQTKGVKLNNEYLGKTLTDRVNQQGYETLIKKVESLPHNYRDVVMRSHQWQVMCYKLEHNQQLSEQEIMNLDELLKLDNFDPHKNFDHWLNYINRFK